MKIWNYGHIKLLNYETMQLYSYGAMELWNIKTMAHWNYLLNYGTMKQRRETRGASIWAD